MEGFVYASHRFDCREIEQQLPRSSIVHLCCAQIHSRDIFTGPLSSLPEGKLSEMDTAPIAAAGLGTTAGMITSLLYSGLSVLSGCVNQTFTSKGSKSMNMMSFSRFTAHVRMFIHSYSWVREQQGITWVP